MNILLVMNKIRKSAKNQECQVRITGICNHDNSTTVFAHLNGAGLGIKHSDLFGAYACSNCHSWLDGGYVKSSTRDIRDFMHLQAVFRTQLMLLEQGLVTIK